MPVRTPRKGGDGRADSLAAIVEALEFALPWLDRLYDPDDEVLVVAVGEEQRLVSDLLAEVPGLDLAKLRRAHRRAVVTLSDENDLEATVAVTSFWDHFEYWILLEGWRDIPVQAQQAFAKGYLDLGIERLSPAIDDVRAGRPVGDPTGNDCFVLLAEAEKIVCDAHRVYVRPCMCRRIYQRCDKPVDVCLWLEDEDRGADMEISRERALELLAEADRAGLMFTANDPQTDRATWICCCCSDCCQPILAAERLGVTGIWPRRRYLATLDADRCTRCRTCVKRCPFGALTMEGKGKSAVLRLETSECRGCGVCSTACAGGAIAMMTRSAELGSP